MKYFFTLLATSLLSGLVLTTPVSAADFTANGTIDSVNLKAGYLVVDDSRQPLSPGVKVYSQSGQAAPLSSLRSGMEIVFYSQGGGAITELRILSSK